MIRISFEVMATQFEQVLVQRGFSPARAETCAKIFAENSQDGVLSHGVNRFANFIQFVDDGYVDPGAEAVLVAGHGAWEQWDGRQGPGMLNARACTERAMDLAREHGFGFVGLRNTNHWMRGGSYGWQAASAGFVFMGWTNTTPNMPPWGAVERRLGNNPLVMAVPRGEGPVVLDMAMTQFSMGRMETAARDGERLPVAGGFDRDGSLSRDPAEILATQRALPVGYWKGAGLALMLDLLAVAASGGLATYQIGRRETEYGVSQVFAAFDPCVGLAGTEFPAVVDDAIDDLHDAAVDGTAGEVLYPGERALRTRADSQAHGIAVDPAIWQAVMLL